MDKVKQNIIQQQQLDKFNIEKSVVGTEAYYINQDIQKGMSGDEIIEKARSGVYKLTAENRKLGRVGQMYGASGEDMQYMGGHRDRNPNDNYPENAKKMSDYVDKELAKLDKEPTDKKEEGFKKGDIVKYKNSDGEIVGGLDNNWTIKSKLENGETNFSYNIKNDELNR